MREALEEAGLGRVREAQLGWLSSLHLISLTKNKIRKEKKEGGG